MVLPVRLAPRSPFPLDLAMDTLTTYAGSSLHLGATLTQQLRQILTRYAEESEVRYAAILEESGTTCAEVGDAAMRDSGETAALAVGAYAALQAVASRLGDSTFEGVFHEGRQRQFCLSPVTPQFMLLSVFEAPVRYAVVKLCAAKAIAHLQEQIETMPVPQRHGLAGIASAKEAGAISDFAYEAASLFRQG